MTQVQMGDEVIETTLPAEAVADLQQPEAEPTPEPQAEETQPEKTEEPAKPEAVAEPVTERPKKAGPIADLLEKKHEAEEKAAQAEAKAAELEAKLAQLSKAPASVQNSDDINALAEKHGLDPEVLADIVAAARKGVTPELPPEFQELLKERQQEKLRQQEETEYNTRLDRLTATFKGEPLGDPTVREKLKALAYSTEKAPDGVPYYQKELSELYFAYIKPEVEPGRVSAEAPKGGKSGQEILDYEDILGDDTKMEEFAKNATPAQWRSFTKWRDEKQGDTKIIRRTN